MKAIILASGQINKMPPITLDIPKQLLKIRNKTILEHLIDRIIEVGIIDEVFIITNNTFYKDFQKWEATSKYINLKIEIINDGTNNKDNLGSIGDIMYAINKKKINDDLMILAGDNIIKSGIRGFHNLFIDKDASIVATHDLKDAKQLAHKFGVICLDETKKIINFEEKPKNPKSTIAATFCYILKKDDIKKIKKYAKTSKTNQNGANLIKYLSENGDVYGYEFDDLWINIRDMKQYKKICLLYKDQKQVRWINKILKENQNDNN